MLFFVEHFETIIYSLLVVLIFLCITPMNISFFKKVINDAEFRRNKTTAKKTIFKILFFAGITPVVQIFVFMGICFYFFVKSVKELYEVLRKSIDEILIRLS